MSGSAKQKLDPIEDDLFDRFASGEDWQDIAKETGVHRNSIINWIHAGGEERKSKYQSAMKAKADWCVEEAGNILRTARHDGELTPAQASLIRDESKRLLWIAERLNKELYGQQQAQVQVNVGVGSLHLDALRQHGRMPTHTEPKLIEATVVSEVPNGA